MTNVIKLEREIYIEMDINIVHYEEGNKLVIYFDRRPFAQELSTHGLNKPGESFDDYCARMEYHQADSPPHFPVPAIPLEAKWYPKHLAGHTLCTINRLYSRKWCTYTGWWDEVSYFGG